MDERRQWRFSQGIQSLLEFIMRTVVQKAECTSARSRIVNYFGHHRVIVAEIQLVTDTDFTGWVYQYIPQAQFFVQLTEQEYFNAGTRFFLVTIQTSRKDFGIVKDKHVFVVEIVQYILEIDMFNFSG